MVSARTLVSNLAISVSIAYPMNSGGGITISTWKLVCIVSKVSVTSRYIIYVPACFGSVVTISNFNKSLYLKIRD